MYTHITHTAPTWGEASTQRPLHNIIGRRLRQTLRLVGVGQLRDQVEPVRVQYAGLRVRRCVCVCVCVCVCDTYIHVCVCMCMYMYMHVYKLPMHVYVCIYIYIYIYTHTHDM